MINLFNWLFENKDDKCNKNKHRRHNVSFAGPANLRISTRKDIINPSLINNTVNATNINNVVVSSSGQSTNVSIRGPRIAIVVHGFASTNLSTVPLANHLDDKYNTVIQFQYDSTLTIESISGTLMSIFDSLFRTAHRNHWQVDLFAHSLGVLVLRYALKYLGLIKYSRRLFAICGPNQGLPSAVSQTFQDVVTVALPSYATAAAFVEVNNGPSDIPYSPQASVFLQKLNSPPGTNDYRTKLHIYSLAGSRPQTFVPFSSSLNLGPSLGSLDNSVYISINPKEVDDGLVSVYSSNSEVLGQDSTSWERNLNQRRITPEDHYSIIGVNTNATTSVGELPEAAATFVTLPIEVQRFIDQFIYL